MASRSSRASRWAASSCDPQSGASVRRCARGSCPWIHRTCSERPSTGGASVGGRPGISTSAWATTGCCWTWRTAEQADQLLEELKKLKDGGAVTFQEVIPALDENWLPGPGGHYAAEFVVSLVRKPGSAPRRMRRPRRLPRRGRDLLRRVYARPPAHRGLTVQGRGGCGRLGASGCSSNSTPRAPGRMT